MSWAPDRSHSSVAAIVPEAFGAQFSWEDGGYRYRRNGVGPAIPVSGDELEAFCLRYVRWSRRMAWVVVSIILAAAVGVTELAKTEAHDPFWIGSGLGLALMIGLYAIYGWARTAPARTLSSRAPVAVALTREEIRRRYLSSAPLWQFIGWVFMPPLWMFTITDGYTSFTPWKLAFVALGAAMMVMGVRRAIQKWRFDQAERAAATNADRS